MIKTNIKNLKSIPIIIACICAFMVACVTTQKLSFKSLEDGFVKQTKYLTEQIELKTAGKLNKEQINKLTNFSTFYYKAKDFYVFYITNEHNLSELDKQSILWDLRDNLNKSEKYKE